LAVDKPIDLIELEIQPASPHLPHLDDSEPLMSSSTDAIRVMLTESEVSSLFPDEVPGPSLLRDIHANLQGAPLDRLKRRIWNRYKAASSPQSMGLVRELAKDVGHRWCLEQKQVQIREEESRSHHFAALRKRVLDDRTRLHESWLEFIAMGRRRQ
jgi:hypothetical protein